MLEEMQRKVFEMACREVVDKYTPMAWPRWKPKPVNEFENFFKRDDSFQRWNGGLIKRVMDSRIENPIRDAFRYFANSEKLRDAYIRKKYGDIENAMRQTGNFSILFDGFLEDFAYRRNQFMEKTNGLIDIKKGELKLQGKAPQSHGGVANLLKVLTSTMKSQGSSIKTIAKVQYAVCLQAGIYIPEEFITDVLVAANIENDSARNT